MGQISTKLIYVKTCPKCLKAYWTTAKRAPKGLCTPCHSVTDRKNRRPIGNLTEDQVKKHLKKLMKKCEERLKNDRIKQNNKTTK